MKQKMALFSRETEDRLSLFSQLLVRWNARINLVSANTEADIWSRHVQDSLRLLTLVSPNVSTAIDLGSGAGFPGLVLAIATDIHVHLIESDRRKAAFLSEAARVTGAKATVHAARIEDRPCGPADLITSRALAPLDRLMELAHPLMTANGTCLFHKGRNVETEITTARREWTMDVKSFPSASDPSSVILRLTRIAHA